MNYWKYKTDFVHIFIVKEEICMHHRCCETDFFIGMSCMDNNIFKITAMNNRKINGWFWNTIYQIPPTTWKVFTNMGTSHLFCSQQNRNESGWHWKIQRISDEIQVNQKLKPTHLLRLLGMDHFRFAQFRRFAQHLSELSDSTPRVPAILRFPNPFSGGVLLARLSQWIYEYSGHLK